MPDDSLSPGLWDQIYNAIKQMQGASPISQGVVSDRDEAKRVVWVRELSSDPIPVVGQSQDLVFYSGKTRQVTKVPPSVPQKGDIVLLIRTTGDAFRCIGVLTPAAEWTAPGSVGFLGPSAVGTRELADASVTTAKFAAGAKTPDSNLLDGLDSLDFLRMASGGQARYHGVLGAPPGSPNNGDIFSLQVEEGIIWNFIYNAGSSSSFKWEFAGGSPLNAFVDTTQSTTSTTYVDLGTVLSLTAVPRAGEYLIEHGFNTFPFGATVENAWATVKIGSAAAADAEGQYGWTNVANMTVTVHRNLRRTLAASDVVKQMYRTVAATTVSFRNRWIKLTPVRIS